MPTSWFDRAADRARNLKGFFNEKDASTFLKIRSKRQEFRQIRSEIETKRQASQEVRGEIEKIKNEIESIKQESKQIKNKLRNATDPAERSEYEESKERLQQERARLKAELRAVKENERTERIGRKKKKKAAQQELFHLERERRAAQEGQSTPDGGGSVPLAEGETGALPDFVIIGGKKCGTTFLYHLLAQHPLVESAASKELHFFDALFEEGVEWYRQFFPAPRWKDGERTITGEASPYMAHRLAPERMAGVVPQARLIALLRNPVERAYSDYQMVARKEREHKTFEEAIGLEEDGDRVAFDEDSEYLSRGVYIDQLLRWSEFFPREQLLVLKSEDFFERPQDTLGPVLEFLGLPEWEPKAWTLRYRRNKGTYEEGMDPSTRLRLEEYFEPHNKRLYDFTGTDFGW